MRNAGSRALCVSMIAASLTAVLLGQAMAQGAPVEFRVTATDRNPSACQRFDAALSRVHTFTPTADGASVTSAGGISSNMKQDSPGIYTTDFSLGSTTLNVTANTTTSPKSLEVREPRIGCRWSAIAP
jgi:hypothetical protein